MAKRNTKADLPLRQTKLTHEQQKSLAVPLEQLEDQLYQLLACQRAYDFAVRSLTLPDDPENAEAEQFEFGVFLYQQQLQQQRDKVMETLEAIQAMVH